MAAQRIRALAVISVSSGALLALACEADVGDDDVVDAGASGIAGASAGGSSAGGGSGGSAGNGGWAGTVPGAGGATWGTGGAAGVSGAAGVVGKGGGFSSGGSGGAAAGSAGNGGKGGKGGGAGRGGAAGASGAAGTAGSAGAAGGPPLPESGCGVVKVPEEGQQTIVAGGIPRVFTVALPTDYDANHQYAVIVSWHGLGGSMGNYYQLNSSSRAGASAIHLSPQGLDNANGDGAGWWNTDGQDLAFVDALLAWTKGSYCVDTTRVFSVGFSFGGMFSNVLGCERGDQFRAIAPIAGSFFNYYGFGAAPECESPVPMLGIHGTADDRVPYADGEAARDVWVAQNGCSATTENTAPEGCVLYQGCVTGYPVEWCAHDGMHMVPSFAADVIWDFFEQF